MYFGFGMHRAVYGVLASVAGLAPIVIVNNKMAEKDAEGVYAGSRGMEVWPERNLFTIVQLKNSNKGK